MTHLSDFVEQMGLAAETDGLSRIAGRLFATLLVSEEPRSLDDLAAALEVSKASVSTEARRLVERGVAVRVARAGDRRDYYELAPDFFAQIIRHRIARWSHFQRLTRELRHSAATRAPAIAARMAEIDEAHAMVIDRIEREMREWTAHRGTRASAPRRRPALRRQPKGAAHG